MKTVVALALSLLAPLAHAGDVVLPPVARVPEPEMWALIGIAAAAFGAARLLRKKSRK